VVGGWGSSALGAMVDLEGPHTGGMHARLRGHMLGLSVEAHTHDALERMSSAPRFDRVTYKVQSGGTLADIGRIYGMETEDLQALNPSVAPGAFIPPGGRVVLFKEGVGLSDVAPGTEERLYAGIPIVDGPGRHVRRRSRSWGTRTTVESLDAALRVYGQAYPEGPVIIVSDLSRRDGGKLKPHHSHREGRDVDLSYVPVPDQDNGGFLKMREGLFDVERNWTFYNALLATGNVEVILMDTRLQKLLYDKARADGMDEAELGRLFQYPRPSDAEVGVIRHWEGHRDHTHIRFRCDPRHNVCPR